MSVAWSTGQTTVIPFFKLRLGCQCAECVDEWTRVRRVQPERIRPDIKPVHVDPVGRYAIQIEWNDGHRTGIYPYELLYEIATDSLHR